LTIEQVFDTMPAVVRASPLNGPRKRPVVAVPAGEHPSLVDRIDRANAEIGAKQLELLGLLLEADRGSVWEDHGARDMSHFASMWLGISWWKADRWVEAARALPALPAIARALACGELSLDKVVELTRFASFEDEDALVGWARVRSTGAIRRRAELERRVRHDEAAQDASSRSLRWWFTEDGRRFALEADLPSADGLVVSRAIARLAATVPVMPGEDPRADRDARRADALVALARSSVSAPGDLERPTVVLHASPEDLASEDRSVEAEGGVVVHAATARRLACTARVQAVPEDASGTPIRLGRMRREPTAWMLRQLRRRDGECTFPGCGNRTFTEGHHIVWWDRGGRTDLDNLVLTCTFHHRLVHEHGWSLTRDDAEGSVTWGRPDGTPYRAGPSPPAETVA
jgi:hypothetical protein